MGTTDGYDPPEGDASGTCEYCYMIPMILEKVNYIEDTVDTILQEILDFKGASDWEVDWTYQLEKYFTEEEIDARGGNAKGFSALLGMINTSIGLNTDIHKDLSAKDGAIAIPEHWQIPLEAQRPQLVVQNAEKLENGFLDSAKYVTTIPHYKYTQPRDTPPFDYIDKGSTQGMLVLKDNSKVIIYAKNQNEATRVLNKIKETIEDEMLKNSYVKLGRIQGEGMKEVRVYPKFGRFYDKGIKEAFKWQTGYKRI
jgi:hypothetical protein